MHLRWFTVSLSLALAVNAAAAVHVANIFNDHMVLQRDEPMPVWGSAGPGEEVTVAFGGAHRKTTAAADGSWLVQLDALPASAEPRVLTVTGSGSSKVVEFNNILVGDVWLAGGQSNMATSAGEAAAAADTPLVRFGIVPSYYPAEAAADLGGRSPWKNGSSRTAAGCPGAALYFARGLHGELGIPIGVIVSATGGTRIEAWLRRAALDAASPENRYRNGLLAAVDEAKTNPPANPENKPPSFIRGTPEWASARLGGRFNGMLAPLTRFPVRGMIWYQGEDNARDHADYAKLLPAFITDLRDLWNRPLPFLIVQLPSYNADRQPDGTHWAAMREVQETVARSVAGCGLVVTLDNDDPGELHPRNKHQVGDRLARLALHQVYGRDEVIASGPRFAGIEFTGPRAVVTFSGGGLVSTSGHGLTGFQIAGADRKFVTAHGRIEHNTVIVSAVNVPEPVAVRYAWTNAPAASLTNEAGLPAAPFRTDSW
jgi:sialate O-acetylesterase